MTLNKIFQVCGLCIALAPSAWAQTVPSSAADAASQQLRQEQDRLRFEQERARQQQRPSGVDLKVPEPGASRAREAGPCINIRAVEIAGADEMYPDERASLVAQYQGGCISASDIQALMGAVTKHYVERGFITTRAYLPEQDLRSGVLRLLVQEGRIEKIQVRGDDAGRINLAWALSAREGDLLNIRDLEQAVDQINSARGNKVKLDLVPGSKPGQTMVVFNNQASNPLGIQFSLDNQGAALTGRESASAILTAGGLLGANETISLAIRRTVPHTTEKSADSVGISYSLPVGYSTVGVNFSESNFSAGIMVPNRASPIILRGASSTMGLSLDRMLARDQSSLHKAVLSLSSVNSKNYADDVLLQVNSRRSNTLAAGTSSTLVVADGLLTVSPQLVLGLNDQSNLPVGLNTQSDGVQAQFTKYTLDASYSKGFRVGQHDMAWGSLFKGQHSAERLLSSQQILIGGLPSVRGYVSNILTGDSGYYWRNDVSLKQQLQLGTALFNTRVYAGYDIGHVSSHDPQAAQGRLSGVVLGTAAQFPNAELDLSWTRADKLPAGMSRESSQVWLRLTLRN
jgi:hemolysin activation/secretion protein